MSLLIRRCIKKPGLIDRARTYRLEHNEQGLYVLYLGPATGEFTKFRPGALEKVMADAALSYFGNRYEKQHLEAEAELERIGLGAFVTKPHCALIAPRSQAEITLSDSDGAAVIKHQKLKLKVFLNPGDYDVMKAIRSAMA